MHYGNMVAKSTKCRLHPARVELPRHMGQAYDDFSGVRISRAVGIRVRQWGVLFVLRNALVATALTFVYSHQSFAVVPPPPPPPPPPNFEPEITTAAGNLFSLLWGTGFEQIISPPKPDNTTAKIAAETEETTPYAPTHLGMYVSPSPVEPSSSIAHLGMYVSQPSDLTAWGAGWGALGSGSVLHSSGYGLSDTAGVLAPGTTSPRVRDVSGSGSIFGTVDATRVLGLPANQSLLLSGYFNYQQDSLSLGSVPAAAPLVVGNAGSLRADSYAFGGDALWRVGTYYLRGSAAYNFGRASESDNVNDSTGSFDTHGYFIDARLGDVFVLLNTTGAPSPTALPTKAPPKPTNGTIVGVDLSGHVGYFDSGSGGFADSSGFTFGTAQASSGDVGGRAKLFALMPGNGLLWVPYVSATVDQLFGFSSTLNIPSQAALPSGDLVNLELARTFAGAELGVDAHGPGGWTVGVRGFFTASADTNIIGGNIFVKIPFNYTPTVASRY